MLQLKPGRKRRVSNGLAIFGAFLLAASLLAGFEGPSQNAEQHAAAQPAATELHAASAAEARQPRTRTRSFRVNLFLFRH